MKKLLLLFALVFLTAGCTLDGDDNKVDFTIHYLPVDNVDLPEYVTPGKTYAFKLYYHRPNTCYYVNNNFYTAASASTLTIAVEAVLLESNACEALSADGAAEFTTFNFECPLSQITDSYTFKFFTGTDDYGKQKYMEVKIPVQL